MKYTEVDILNYVEGRLNDTQTAEFLASLRTDLDLAQAVTAMQVSQLPIRQAYQQNPFPPVPAALQARVEALIDNANTDQISQGSKRVKSQNGLRMGLGVAACLLFGVCVGALVSQIYWQSNVG